MGSQNDGEPKDTKPPRRGRLFEVSPPPDADAAPAIEPSAEPDDGAVEPLTEPFAPLEEDAISIDPAAIAPVDDASEASAKLAHDERMRKPIAAASYTAGENARRSRPEVSMRPEPVPSPMVRRSAPAVGLHPSPRRRGLGWLWVFGPAVIVVAILAALYLDGYRIGPQGLVPPRRHAITR